MEEGRDSEGAADLWSPGHVANSLPRQERVSVAREFGACTCTSLQVAAHLGVECESDVRCASGVWMKDDTLDELDQYPRALADEVLRVFDQWLVWRVDNIVRSTGRELGHAEHDRVVQCARDANVSLRGSLVALLKTDVDEQRKGPLQVIREASLLMNSVLRDFGIAEAVRDEFDARSLPEDVYGIGPLAWRDLGDEVHEAGIEWGAWKAATVLQRRRNEGKLDE